MKLTNRVKSLESKLQTGDDLILIFDFWDTDVENDESERLLYERTEKILEENEELLFEIVKEEIYPRTMEILGRKEMLYYAEKIEERLKKVKK